MYPVGTLVTIKTTGEEACVIASTFVPTGTTDNTINTTEVVRLRVPRITRDGILHYDIEMFAFEVESKLDSFKREIESIKQRNEILKAAQAADAASPEVGMPAKVN